MRNWKERHISETGNRSMEFRDQKNWHKRTPEEQARLQFLRQKQQPEVDWTRNWDKFELDDKISKNDAFEAGKVRYYSDEAELEAVVASVTRTEAVTHLWETYRLKAVLRSGKMLSDSLMKKIGPSTHWVRILSWIEEEGDLPGLSQEVLDAVIMVWSAGWRDALDDIMAGRVASQSDRGGQSKQNRALELVTKILRAWEADRHRSHGRPDDRMIKMQEEE